ncbi:MAG: sugar phosphorylase [Candidatus Eiseniibacteriota bacterium]|nr:MAG: sugar phosphorylase [Candidatus Eisenbacteria bacterium]
MRRAKRPASGTKRPASGAKRPASGTRAKPRKGVFRPTHGEFNEAVRAPGSYLDAHLPEPDYARPLLRVPEEKKAAILEKLTFLYGSKKASQYYPEVERIMRVYYAHKTAEMIKNDAVFDPAQRFTEKDSILITYGDLITGRDEKPLKILQRILRERAKFITTIHLLPFFPSSSDRGFSIISYFSVDPNLGTWEDIQELGKDFRLMFDGVINHVSAKSKWFQEFLNGNPYYKDFFTQFSSMADLDPEALKRVMRPRTTPLLTRFEAIDGPRHIWTTFSPDQVDLNYKNVNVLLRVLDVLLFYVRRGADIIRLDAVTYLWEELGTASVHMEQTHQIIQLFRLILDVVAPHVALLTETNVPHEDNLKYFGDGHNEAQLVYNFALPPLVLHSFHTGNCRKMSRWAAGLERISGSATYFNFLDSHDGVGLMAVRGILSEYDIGELMKRTLEYGGMVSYMLGEDGRHYPYELNIAWYSAVNGMESDEPIETQIDRFVASRSVQLVLRGVPGSYLPSVIGTENDVETVLRTGAKRDINRRAFDVDALMRLLEDRSSRAHLILERLSQLAGVRVHCPAFHPSGEQSVIMRNDAVFSLVRTSLDGSQRILALTNVTGSRRVFRLEKKDVERWPRVFENLLTGEVTRARDNQNEFRLRPFEVQWLLFVDP